VVRALGAYLQVIVELLAIDELTAGGAFDPEIVRDLARLRALT